MTAPQEGPDMDLLQSDTQLADGIGALLALSVPSGTHGQLG